MRWVLELYEVANALDAFAARTGRQGLGYAPSDPAEVAAVVGFLADEDSRFTGQTIYVNGNRVG